ncbi:hypothetical protein KAI87_12245, partial [Myxococcota bacterium]|nr:hypothetical protein [Myxococcota bacterium]
MKAAKILKLAELSEATAKGRLSPAELAGFSQRELDAIYALGAFQLDAGQAESAATVFSGLVSLYPYSSIYWRALGIVHQRLLDYRAARGAYEASLILEPDNEYTLCFRGEVLVYLDEFIAARQDLVKARELATERAIRNRITDVLRLLDKLENNEVLLPQAPAVVLSEERTYTNITIPELPPEITEMQLDEYGDEPGEDTLTASLFIGREDMQTQELEFFDEENIEENTGSWPHSYSDNPESQTQTATQVPGQSPAPKQSKSAKILFSGESDNSWHGNVDMTPMGTSPNISHKEQGEAEPDAPQVHQGTSTATNSLFAEKTGRISRGQRNKESTSTDVIDRSKPRKEPTSTDV